MKKILRFCILLLLSSPLLAQDFGTVGTQWYYSDVSGGMGPIHSGYHWFRSVSDTLILGKTAHKIEFTVYSPQGNIFDQPPIFVYGEADTAFIYSPQKGHFIPLHIFNAQIGDTLTFEFPIPLGGSSSSYQIRVDSISMIRIDGTDLKQFTVSPVGFPPAFERTIIERIGGKLWFFPMAVNIPEIPGPIRCYSDAQLDTNFFNFACDYSSTSSVNEINESFQVKIYPNPATDQVFIVGPESGFKMRLFDLQGRLLLEDATPNSQLEIEVVRLKVGVYTIEIIQADGKRNVQRLLKQ